jgi:hypothetical protein
MTFNNDNAEAARNLQSALQGIGSFFLNRDRLQVEKPRIEAETKAAKEAADRAQWEFENGAGKQNFLQSFNPLPPITNPLPDGMIETPGGQPQPAPEQPAYDANTPFEKLPLEVQQDYVRQYREKGPQFNINPIDVAQAYHAHQLRVNPPVPPEGLTPDSASYKTPGGMEVKFGRPVLPPNVATPIVGPNGVPVAGLLSVGGKTVTDPGALSPEKIAEKKKALLAFQGTADAISSAQKLLSEHDNLVGPGPGGGGTTGRFISWAQALAGSPENMTNQRELDMLINKKVLESVAQMKGAWSDKDIAFLKSQTPKLSDPPEVWNKFLNLWGTMNQELMAATLGGSALSGVSLLAPATAPQGTSSGGGEPVPGSSSETAIPVNSLEEYKNLQPGQYYRDSAGNVGQKKSALSVQPSNTLPSVSPNSYLIKELINQNAFRN